MNLQPRLSTTSFEFADAPIGDGIEMSVLGGADQIPLTSSMATMAAPVKIGAPRQMQYPHDIDRDNELIGQPRFAQIAESPRTLWGWNLLTAGFMFLIFAMALTGMVLGILAYQKNLQQQDAIHRLKDYVNFTTVMTSSPSSFADANTVDALSTTLAILQIDVTALQTDLTSAQADIAAVTACCANSTANIDALDGIILALEQCCVDNAQSISALVPSCSMCP